MTKSKTTALIPLDKREGKYIYRFCYEDKAAGMMAMGMMEALLEIYKDLGHTDLPGLIPWRSIVYSKEVY